MIAQVRHIDNHGIHYDALAFWCPGCDELPHGGSGLHLLPVNTTEHSPSWTWDGNLEAPTLSPSILTCANDPGCRCHSFLRAGVLEFLDDCAHSMAGQHVPLPDLPDWFVEEAATGP